MENAKFQFLEKFRSFNLFFNAKSQEDLCEEESLYNFPPAEDNKALPGFHDVDWDKKLSYLQKFKDKRRL